MSAFPGKARNEEDGMGRCGGLPEGRALWQRVSVKVLGLSSVRVIAIGAATHLTSRTKANA